VPDAFVCLRSLCGATQRQCGPEWTQAILEGRPAPDCKIIPNSTSGALGPSSGVSGQSSVVSGQSSVVSGQPSVVSDQQLVVFCSHAIMTRNTYTSMVL